MSGDSINIGGVNFDKNIVKSHLSGINNTTNKNVYSVFMHDGSKFSFEEQDVSGSKAKPSVGKAYSWDSDLVGYKAFGIKGLHVEGTNNEGDYYELKNCEDYSVDIGDGEADELVISSTDENIDVNDGVIISDSNDKITKKQNKIIEF